MDESQKNKYAQPRDFIKVTSKSGSEDILYSTFYKDVPEGYKLFARETLGETEENKRKVLKALKEFALRENLACTDYDMISVLRCTKYNLKKSESKLKKFVQLRQNLVQWLANMDDCKVELILDDMCFGVLPYRDKHGRLILFSRPNLHLDLYDMDDVKVVFLSLLLYLLNFPLTSMCGLSYIAEAYTDTPSIYYHILKGYSGIVKNILNMPIQIKMINIMNESSIVRWFYNFVRPFLSNKVIKRVRFNGNSYEFLKEIFHPDILPEDFGGNSAPLNNNCYRDRVMSFIQKLKAESVNPGY